MVIKRDFNYSPNGKNRRLHIHLPNNYFNCDERYPVMYFFDGHNLFEDSEATYGKSWGLEAFLNSWDKPIIIVGVECGHEGDERLSEYLPYHPEFGFFSRFDALGEATLRWIVEELKPVIDHDFRTIPFRECTGIGGSSMGGLMALYGIVHWNTWFSKGACISSAIRFCGPQLMNDMRRSNIDPDTRAFLSWGTIEANAADSNMEDRKSYTYRANKAAANKFIEKNALPKLYCQIGGKHCEADWERQIPMFMEFLWNS